MHTSIAGGLCNVSYLSHWSYLASFFNIVNGGAFLYYGTPLYLSDLLF